MRVQDSGFWGWGSGSWVEGLARGFGVLGLGSRIEGWGFGGLGSESFQVLQVL